MRILNGKLPERILRQLARRPMLFISGLSLSLKLGKDGVQYSRGKIDASEFRKRAGSSVGGVGLGAAGSYAGLVAGHFLMPVPVLGGLLGGFAGGALGEIMGDKLGRKAVEKAEVAFGVAAQQEEKAEATEAPEASSEPEASPDEAPRAQKAPPRRHI